MEGGHVSADREGPPTPYITRTPHPETPSLAKFPRKIWRHDFWGYLLGGKKSQKKMQHLSVGHRIYPNYPNITWKKSGHFYQKPSILPHSLPATRPAPWRHILSSRGLSPLIWVWRSCRGILRLRNCWTKQTETNRSKDF